MDRAANSTMLTVISRGMNLVIGPLLVAVVLWASSSLGDMVTRQGRLESDLRVANVKLDALAANHYTSQDAIRDNSLMTAKVDNINIAIKATVDALKDRVDRLERQPRVTAPTTVIRSGTR